MPEHLGVNNYKLLGKMKTNLEVSAQLENGPCVVSSFGKPYCQYSDGAKLYIPYADYTFYLGCWKEHYMVKVRIMAYSMVTEKAEKAFYWTLTYWAKHSI